MVSATKALSEYIAGLGPADVPDAVLHQAKRCLIDWLGVTIAGSTDPSTDIMWAGSDVLGSADEATVLGRTYRSSVARAALVNGFASHVLDYDDTYNPQRTTVHGSAPVWPVVLGLAERDQIPGDRALVAFVAGFESEVRIALAAGPAHYEAGWHVTGTVGHFGAAAAAARLFGLEPSGVANALGAAGTQAAGLKGVYGSMGKALHPGKAAMDGLLAAELAREGFTASEDIVERKHGFLQVLSPDADVSLVARGLGTEWTVLEDGFKPYACGSLTHPTIEGVLELRRLHDVEPQTIRSIEATVNDYVSWVTAKETPTTGLEGKFSIYHAAAVAALDGKASVEQFHDTRVTASDVVEMRDRVRIAVDEALNKDAASVTMILSDGRRLTCSIEHNKGTPAKPMTDDEIESKFVDLVEPRLGPDRTHEVLERCWNLDRHDDAGEVARLCRAET